MSIHKLEKGHLQIDYLKNMLGDAVCAALDDDSVTDIFLNPDSSVWIKSAGKGQQKIGSIDEHKARAFINQLAQINALYINQSNPTYDENLPFNGERIIVTVESITKRPSFAIRKPSKTVFDLESYIEKGVLNQKQYDLICKAISERQNILISGGTQTGKTTLLNSCLLKMKELCGEWQRLLILQEGSDEIRSSIENCVHFYTADNVSMTKLVKISMRYTPDKIIVGEVKDGACLDLLKAWNTGHSGGLSTIHANSADAVPLRLSYLSQEAGVPSPNYLIVEAIDLIVHLVHDTSHPAGRRVENILRLTGFKNNQFTFESYQ